MGRKFKEKEGKMKEESVRVCVCVQERKKEGCNKERERGKM